MQNHSLSTQRPGKRDASKNPIGQYYRERSVFWRKEWRQTGRRGDQRITPSNSREDGCAGHWQDRMTQGPLPSCLSCPPHIGLYCSTLSQWQKSYTLSSKTWSSSLLYLISHGRNLFPTTPNPLSTTEVVVSRSRPRAWRVRLGHWETSWSCLGKKSKCNRKKHSNQAVLHQDHVPWAACQPARTNLPSFYYQRPAPEELKYLCVYIHAHTHRDQTPHFMTKSKLFKLEFGPSFHPKVGGELSGGAPGSACNRQLWWANFKL